MKSQQLTDQSQKQTPNPALLRFISIEIKTQNTLKQVIYYHNDHLGSTGVVTNESGDIVEETFYEPFGSIISGGELTMFDYEGREFSELTGDYDFRFRKYDSSLGIFTQPDAGIQDIYDPQALNRYAFERNNPYLYVDEDRGLFITTPVIAGLIITVGFAYVAEFIRGNSYEEAANRAGQDVGGILEGNPEDLGKFGFGLQGFYQTLFVLGGDSYIGGKSIYRDYSYSKRIHESSKVRDLDLISSPRIEYYLGSNAALTTLTTGIPYQIDQSQYVSYCYDCFPDDSSESESSGSSRGSGGSGSETEEAILEEDQ